MKLEYTSDPTPAVLEKPGTKGSPQEWSELCSIVTAYKLADVAALLEVQPSDQAISVRKSQKIGPVKSIPVRILGFEPYATMLIYYQGLCKAFQLAKAPYHVSTMCET